MPKRTPFHDVSMHPAHNRTSTVGGMVTEPLPSLADLRNGMEHLREGTREQWESEWTPIEATGSFAFTHNLGEIPWVVDVIGSLTTDGKFPLNRNASVTVAKTETTITVTNNTTTQYFKVRAM